MTFAPSCKTAAWNGTNVVSIEIIPSNSFLIFAVAFHNSVSKVEAP